MQAGVTVTLENLTTLDTDTRTTEADGTYIFDDIPAGYSAGQTIEITVLDSIKTFVIPALDPLPEPQLIDFTIDTKEITGYYDLLLQKELTYSFDVLLQKEYSGINDILLQKEFTGQYTVTEEGVVNKEYTGSYDILLQSEYSVLYDLLAQKSLTGSYDVFLLTEFSSPADILTLVEFEAPSDIHVNKELTGQYTIVTVYDSKEFTSSYDIHAQKEFEGKYDIYTPATVHLFNVFDHMYSLYHVNILSSGATNSNGDWVAETSEEITLYAHISDISIQERKFMNPVLVRAGARKIAVLNSAGLQIGDRIRITEIDNSTTSTWRIYQKQYCPALINEYVGINRETFLMTRVV